MALQAFCALATVFLVLVALSMIDTPLVECKGRTTKPKKGPKPAFARGLVTEDVDYETILEEHENVAGASSPNRTAGAVLAYVTPWNKHGYTVAKSFATKFTHVAPVWYQIKPPKGGKGGAPLLEGKQDADRKWMEAVRKAAVRPAKGGSKDGDDAGVKIVPRFYFDAWSKESLELLLSSSAAASQAVSLVLDECTRNGYDGVVLDAWLGWYATGALADVGMRKKAQAFVILLSSYLQAERRDLILAVPPLSPDYEERIAAAREKGGLAAVTAAAHRMPFTPEDFTALYKHVTGFSLMTYDFSGLGNVGPAGPLWWQGLNVQTLINHAVNNAWMWGESYARRSVEDVAMEVGGKILLGLNMYGINYELPTTPNGRVSGTHLVGSQYLDILRQHRPLFQWDDTAKEHVFDYSPAPNVTRIVYYPTLMSLEARLSEIVREMHLGVSIWEIGQGLDYFYDLL